MPSEFALIEKYFVRPTRHTLLAGGDDAALLQVSPGMHCVVSSDMLVSGVHFLSHADPADIGWKALAVNVSDLAAMGALPRWATLALSLPAADECWLDGFARGFFACAQTFDIDLIGGDTTRGPLNICVSIMGELPPGSALLRSGALAGDDLWVSGYPGLASLGLETLQNRVVLRDEACRHRCLAALHRPQPRIALGQALRGIAHAAIDVSDGLLADLGHMARSSRLNAWVEFAHLPCPAWDAVSDDAHALATSCVLAGGDDYELLFSAPLAARSTLEALAKSLGIALTRIGRFAAISDPSQQAGEVFLHDAQGRAMAIPGSGGFDHFRSPDPVSGLQDP
jgi:thiamine-monophosphate kinase